MKRRALPPRAESVFAPDRTKVWSHQFNVTLEIDGMHGGVPSDPNVRRGWLLSRLAPEGEKDSAKNQRLMELISQAEAEIGDADKASDAISVNGFKRNANDELCFEARCVKAAIKEYFSIALGGGHINARGWGATNKGMSGFIAEHIMVTGPELIPLLVAGKPITAPDDIDQRFVSTYKGQSISYTEMVDRCTLSFVVVSDWDFPDTVWRTIWLLGEEQGIGSMRSQGAGRFVVTEWDSITATPKKRSVKRAS